VLTVNEIAKAITATRDAFSVLFLQAQIGIEVEDRVGFEAVTHSADDKEAFAEALTHAQLKGWMDTLIDAIIAAGLEDGHLADEVRKSGGDAELQAMVNSFANFMQPYIVSKGIDSGMRWTGKIVIDNMAQGTGILIANNRVLTAWHVVKSLFVLGANNSYEPVQNIGNRLEVIFDDFLQKVGRGQSLKGRGTRRVIAHADWCVAYSNCHQEELASRLPANLSTLDGYWDYAVIRLAEPVGFERGWATLNSKATVPKAQEKVVLIQHPTGQTMRLDIADIAAADAPQQTAIPRLRFLHYGNALNGSSGGPCFDKSFALFGFHQGQWSGAAQATNRGIPIARVIEHINTKYGGLQQSEPKESLIWKLGLDGQNAPVIGCDEFQQLVLQSAVSGKPRLFTIAGNSGSGKTFHTKVLSAMLPDAGHLKIKLNSEAISKMDAPELARVICTGAGAKAPDLSPPSEIHSTTATWLKEEVVNKIVERLDEVRNGRLVWISILELDAFDLEGENASQMLLLLYEQLLATDWLRIVLDGMKGDIPASLRDILYRHRVREITREQIEIYLRRLSTFLDLDLGAGIQTDGLRLFRKYEDALLAKSEEAAELLATEVMETAHTYMVIAGAD
jgi:Trypsin-like peptidase domain